MEIVERCLRWDPGNRMTPEEGLYQQWLREPEYIAKHG